MELDFGTTMLSLYLSKPSWLHSIPARLKLLTLAAASMLLLSTNNLLLLSMALAVSLACFFSLGQAGRQRLFNLVKSLGPMLILLGIAQWLTLILSLGIAEGFAAGGYAAAVTLGRLGVLVLLADLVTLSTPTQDLLDAIAPILRPLAWLGLPWRRLQLAIGLMLRWVSLLNQEWNQTRDAFAARGCHRPRHRIITPVLHRAYAMASLLSESLTTRLGDPARPIGCKAHPPRLELARTNRSSHLGHDL